MSRAHRILAIMVTVVLILSVPGSVFAQSQKVVEVAISGNFNINSDAIRNFIGLKPGMDYTDQDVQKDRVAIMSLGTFSAVSPHKEDVPGGVKVTYEVTENSKVTSIKIVGNEPIPADKVLGLMKTKVGQVLNTNTLDQDAEAIQTYYGDQGYIAALTEDFQVDAKTGILTVPITVTRVEDITVTGNKKTKAWVFLREMKTKPGKVLNVKVLDEDMIRIYNLDILDTYKHYQFTPGTEIGMVKITIPVVEKKTGTANVGFGYSSKQRLVGEARLAETNFRGLAQHLSLDWQEGTSEATGGPSSEQISFTEPWLDKKHTSLSVDGFNTLLYRFSSGIFNTSTFNNYNERHQGGDLTLSRPVTDTSRVYVGGKFEYVNTDPNLLQESGGKFSPLVNIVQKGNVTGGSLRLLHNSRDINLDPAAGGYDDVSFEFGTVDATGFKTNKTLTSYESIPVNGPFTKTSIDERRYFSKGGRKLTPDDKRLTLALRLKAGFASGTLPFFEQFFLGGAESLRGYREDRFYGNKMLLASAELRRPIAQSISGVVFVDYGDAWGSPTNFSVPQLPQSEAFAGNFGIGVGMRINTPIGHLRLDYGIGSEGGRTHFSMGQAF